jgi:hypothetical protein
MESMMLANRLVEGLESSQLLPSGLRAKSLQANYRIPLPEGLFEVDLIIEFSLQPEGIRVLSAIECKSRLSPMDVQLAAAQLRRIKEKLRDFMPGEQKEPCLMVAAPYISESTQNACKQLGLGYIDLNRNLYLVSDGIHIEISRPAKEFKPEQGIKAPYFGKSRRIVRVLLSHPAKQFKLDELAQEAGTSISQASYVVRRLREDRFLEKNESGVLLTKPGKLLKTLAAEAQRDYQKNRKIFFTISADDTASTIRRLANYCDQKQLDYAFALFTGLEKYEQNVLESVNAIYTSADPYRIAEEMRFPFASKGANLYIMCPPLSDNTSEGGVFYQTRRVATEVRAVSLVQAYMDFTYYPGRGEEQARYIFERLLGFTD